MNTLPGISLYEAILLEEKREKIAHFSVEKYYQAALVYWLFSWRSQMRLWSRSSCNLHLPVLCILSRNLALFWSTEGSVFNDRVLLCVSLNRSLEGSLLTGLESMFQTKMVLRRCTWLRCTGTRSSSRSCWGTEPASVPGTQNTPFLFIWPARKVTSR